MNENKFEIVEYRPEFQPHFEQLNRSWIQVYFRMEPVDEFVLANPAEAILIKGGAILMATVNGRIAGTVALRKQTPGVYELTKMTIDLPYRGMGYGEAMCRAAIQKAESMGASKLVLYSSSRLKPAIQLYRKLGFVEVPVETGTYARCDIKMEILFPTISVQQAGERDAATIATIGRESFRDAFLPFFYRRQDLMDYLDYTYNPEKIKQSLAKSNNVFLLAYKDEVPAGFVKVKIQSLHKLIADNRQMELQKIYVLPQFHGKGVGIELIKSAIKLAEKVQTGHIWLDVWTGNGRAVRFYKRTGFTTIGQHTFTIGSQPFDYHVMTIPLNRLSTSISKNRQLSFQKV